MIEIFWKNFDGVDYFNLYKKPDLLVEADPETREEAFEDSQLDPLLSTKKI